MSKVIIVIIVGRLTAEIRGGGDRPRDEEGSPTYRNNLNVNTTSIMSMMNQRRIMGEIDSKKKNIIMIINRQDDRLT